VAPMEEGPSDEHLAALWRTFASPPPGPSAGWMLLEHELWLYASRNDGAREHFAARFAEARRRVVESTASWPDDGLSELPGTPDQVASLLVALLVGLEMQHRVDPGAVSDETAVLGLRAVTGLRAAQADIPPETDLEIDPETVPDPPTPTTERSTTSRTPKSGAPRRTSPTRRTS